MNTPKKQYVTAAITILSIAGIALFLRLRSGTTQSLRDDPGGGQRTSSSLVTADRGRKKNAEAGAEVADPRLIKLFSAYPQLSKDQVQNLLDQDPRDHEQLAVAAWYHQDRDAILAALRGNSSKTPVQLITLYHFSLSPSERSELVQELIRLQPGNGLGGILYAKSHLEKDGLNEFESVAQYLLKLPALELPTQDWKRGIFETWRTAGMDPTEARIMASTNPGIESAMMREVEGLAILLKEAKYESSINPNSPQIKDIEIFEKFDTMLSSFNQELRALGESPTNLTKMVHMRVLGMLPQDSSINGGSTAQERLRLHQEHMSDSSSRDAQIQSMLRHLEGREVDLYFEKAYDLGLERANDWLLSKKRLQNR